MRCYLAILILAVAAADLSARTWTSRDGKKTTEAELVRVEVRNGKKYAVLKRKSDGKEVRCAARVLSSADRKVINAFLKNNPDPQASKGKAGQASLDDVMKKNLIRLKDEELLPYPLKREVQFYVLYFAAQRFKTCREFTPKLIDFYNGTRKYREKAYELIFVSADLNADAMKTHVVEAKMPWPVLVYTRKKSSNAITKYDDGKRLPRLVVIDREGKVVVDTYDGDDFLGPNAALQLLHAKLKAQEQPK